MKSESREHPHVAIACGGTGGHFFPGVAVAAELRDLGCQITLLVSEKEVDQAGLRTAAEFQALSLPAVGLVRGAALKFFSGFVQSYSAARQFFRGQHPDAVLAMGGFTAAPPIVAGKRAGARVFLHESNTIPGRANRWLSHVADCAFVGFPQTAQQFKRKKVVLTGTPVRPRFAPLDPSTCREKLGLDRTRLTLLVMGGSQGAAGVNQALQASIPELAQRVPGLQVCHLAGRNDVSTLSRAYASAGIPARVFEFLDAMEIAMGAADAAVSRAGASSMAELAAMRIPMLLIPYPSATDNHQYHNARAFERSGAALLLDQKAAGPGAMVGAISDLLTRNELRLRMRESLAAWHSPDAAVRIATGILSSLGETRSHRANVSLGPRNLKGFPSAIA